MYEDIARYRSQTHMHVIGASGTGKSKALEYLIRNDIKSGKGLCLIDWHGTLYNDVLNFLSVVTPSRPVVLLNPSAPSLIVGFNPFIVGGADVATAVARRLDATIRPWGMQNTNETPTLEKVLRMLYHFSVISQENLPNASLLLRQQNAHLRDYAISITENAYVRELWQELQAYTPREWREQTVSTNNKLARFLFSENMQRFMCRTSGNLDVFGMMEAGGIVLVNLGSSDFLDREAARVFASLLLNEFFEAAMRRALVNPRPRTFSLYCDEFGEYATSQMSSMLDQVRKGGLHLVLSHQRLGHLQRDPELLESVLTNARMRAVFGGLPYSNTHILTMEMALHRINENRVKATNYRITPRVRESEREITTEGVTGSRGRVRTRGGQDALALGCVHGRTVVDGLMNGLGSNAGIGASDGENSNGMEISIASEQFAMSEISAHSHAEARNDAISRNRIKSNNWSDGEQEQDGFTRTRSVHPFTETYYVQEKVSDEFFTLEEKIAQEAERQNRQDQRDCRLKFPTSDDMKWTVPIVEPMRLREVSLASYQFKVSEPHGALPPQAIDAIRLEGERRFLEKAGKEELPFAVRRRRS